MWRKGNPPTLLVGMETDTASMEDGMEVLKTLGIKPLCDSAYTLRKPKLKKTHVSQCSLQHYLQQLEHRSNLDVHQQMNG